MQDIISREIIVKAKKEQVYAALTDPKKIIAWFPDAVEGDLKVGKYSILDFGKENGKSQIYVVAANPFDYFSYRWVPGGFGVEGQDVLSVPNTLVEFFIEEQKDGTKIRVKESGFSSLPTEIAEQSFNKNSGGWEFVMDSFKKVMNQK